MSHFGVPHTVNHAASGALRRNGKAAMSRIDRSKSRSAGGKGFYIALALCLAAVGAIGYFMAIIFTVSVFISHFRSKKKKR